jgi:hypothetical protein
MTATTANDFFPAGKGDDLLANECAKHLIFFWTALDSSAGRDRLGLLSLCRSPAVHVFFKLERYSSLGSRFLRRPGLYDCGLSWQRYMVPNGSVSQSRPERTHGGRANFARAKNHAPVRKSHPLVTSW